MKYCECWSDFFLETCLYVKIIIKLLGLVGMSTTPLSPLLGVEEVPLRCL